MPNWCDGNIRVRGTFQKIVKLFSESLFALKLDEKRTLVDIPVKIVWDGPYFVHLDKPEDGCENEFWFKDSRRQFMDVERIELADYSDDDSQEIVICIEGFHGAWNIDLECFQALAKKYQVDIRIVAYDRGMEFCDTAEFYCNGKFLNKVIRYNDWMWECPRPNLGG